jgi:HK97 family phage major capsid protein
MDTTVAVEKTEEIKKLDAYIESKMDAYMEAKANDPEAQKKAAVQTKYMEAMADSLIGKGEVELTESQKKDALGKFASIVLRSNNDRDKAAMIAEKDYKNDKFITGCFKALTSGTPSEGGFAVPEILSSVIIDTLNPNLVYSKLGSTRIDMPNGNMRIPRFDARAAATYIGETKAGAATKQTIGNIVGSSKKLSAIIPISNDLIRNANAGFTSFVQNSLVTTLKLKKDYTALYGDGGANSPAGIKTQILSGQKIGSSTTAFTADTPANLMSICMASDVPGLAYGWAFNAYHFNYLFNLKTTTGAYIYRDEMNQGKLLGHPFVVSNQVYSDNLAGKTAPTTSNYGEMFFGDWSEFIEFVQLDMELMAFKEASFVDESGTTLSCMQNDMTALRAICLHDFGLKHTEAFAISTNKYAAT